MNATLRAMNLGEILDRTFQIYKAHFFKFTGIAAIPALGMLGINAADYFWLDLHSIFSHSRQYAPLWNAVIWLGYFHATAFLALLISSAHVRLASAASLDENSSMMVSLLTTARRWRSCLVVSVLKFAVEIVIPEILLVLLIFGAAVAVYFAGELKPNAVDYVFVIAGPAVAAFILFMWLGSCLSLAIPASALEEKSGFGAVRRSWSLSKDSRARIMVVWFVIIACSWLMAIGTQRIFSWAFSTLLPRHAFGPHGNGVFLAASSLLYAVNSVLIGPIYPIAVTLIYYDQRIRLEGYDIERMMDSAGMIAPIITPEETEIATPVAPETYS